MATNIDISDNNIKNSKIGHRTFGMEPRRETYKHITMNKYLIIQLLFVKLQTNY